MSYETGGFPSSIGSLGTEKMTEQKPQGTASKSQIEADRPWVRYYEQGVPPSIGYLKMPLFSFLEESAQRFPNHPAIYYFGAKISYRTLDQLVNRFGNALLSMGVKKSDRVALMLPNTPHMVIAYYGTLKIGAIVVPTNPLYTERELEYQLRDSGAETLVTITRLYPTVATVRDKVSLKNIVVGNVKDFFPPVLRLLFTLFREAKEGHRLKPGDHKRVHNFQGLLRHHSPKLPDVEVEDEQETALFQYTGGTTGLSKAAMLSHYNLVTNAMQVRHWLTDTQVGRERFLTVLPLFHAYGMTTCMNFAISTASAMVLLPRFDTKEVLEIIDRYQPTIFPGVPTMYIAINNHPEVEKYNLRSIRACISGAAPLPVEVQSRFEQLTGARLVEGYGLTEAAPVTHSNPIYGKRKVGSIGLPFPDVEAKIVDMETGEKETPVGESGELVLRGPQVMQGYWNRPEETAQTIRNGWLYTGDIAKRDKEGYFYIVDRKKEMILTSGYNVYPREVEEVLYEHPKVKEAAVIGVADPYKGEAVKAFIVLKDGETANQDEIIDYCRSKLARYKVPQSVEFRHSLPKSLIGKVLRRVLAEEERARQANKQ